ncbi:MAG: hypothetical protein AAF950_16285 [Pseudomonadota bacterium]
MNILMSSSRSVFLSLMILITHNFDAMAQNDQPLGIQAQITIRQTLEALKWSTEKINDFFEYYNEVFDEGAEETRAWLAPQCRSNRTRDIPAREWDAFGHCWFGCRLRQRCSLELTGKACDFLGTGREVYRELQDVTGFEAHDSFWQDIKNQDVGEDLALASRNTSQSCTNLCALAAQRGELDLSAPDDRDWLNCRTGALLQRGCISLDDIATRSKKTAKQQPSGGLVGFGQVLSGTVEEATCAVAMATHKRLLTGNPAGRQTWEELRRACKVKDDETICAEELELLERNGQCCQP